MLRQQARLIRMSLIWADLCVVVLALLLAHRIGMSRGWQLTDVRSYMWILVAALPAWHFFMTQQGLYSSVRRMTFSAFSMRLLNVHIFAGVVVVAVVALCKGETLNRPLFFLFFACAYGLLFTYRAFGLFVLRRMRSTGYNTRHILIVGTREKARKFHELLKLHKDWGFTVVGFLQASEGKLLDRVDGHAVLGRESDLIDVCRNNTVDEVVFCVPGDYVPAVEHSLQLLEELGITVRVVVDFWNHEAVCKELDLFHDELPIVTFYTRSLDSWQLLLKRSMDILGASVGLTITGLLLPFIAIAIKRSDPGPIFFSQERIGQGGRHFQCWKFRSMYTDAEARKQELMEKNEMSGAIFKIKDDPRIFPFGHFLRDTSLDELPQFWNVLKGEMSLVGTRPPTPNEVEQYENWHRRRISIKPGITGLWQVSGRNNIDDFDEIVKLDLHYIDNWSIWYDICLLFRTLKIVIVRDGSC
jgi:exopolysaccharide biosynthesis polyprenyl glycosylphosphotransferase